MQRNNKQIGNKVRVAQNLRNQEKTDPIKSCNLDRPHKITRYPNQKYSLHRIDHRINSISIASQSAQKSQSKNILFTPLWKSNTNSQQKQKQDQNLIDLYLKKNEQIAASLLKQKKSVSDYVYISDKTKKISRYIAMKSDIDKDKDRRDNHKKLDNLPKINRVVIIESENSRNQEESTEQQIIQENEYKAPVQPEYTKITNINIQKFLKLKQQAYNLKTIQQQRIKAKKKVHNHNKKIIRKKKQIIKNSLQEYLQAKIIPKQNQFQSLRATSRNNATHQNMVNIIGKMRQRKSLQNPLLSQQPLETAKQQTNNQANTTKKINYNSIKKNKIGTNTKFSQKQLFFDGQGTVYDNKIKQYRQFLFIINLAHHHFDPIHIQDVNTKNQVKYKYYVGKGNNRQLVKALMKRRFWWVETDNPFEANFVWTQLKMNQYYQLQNSKQRDQQTFYERNQEKIVTLKQSKSKPINNISPTKKNILYKPPLPTQNNEKILSQQSISIYQNFLKQIRTANNIQKFNNFQNRLKYFTNHFQSGTTPQTKTNKIQLHIHNHLENNFLIGNKKALFYNLKKYCELTNKNIFDMVPLTFHIGENGMSDPNYKQFLKYFREIKQSSSHNLWIVKPGQNSNRGNGITVCQQLREINKIIKNKKKQKQQINTFIIQKYIEKPLLYKGRKFDIRHYVLATKMYGRLRLYWYSQGYIRTSSSDFDLEQIEDVQIHLTNDAIQQYATNYGKFQEGNKISYAQLQKYIDVVYPHKKYSISNDLYPKMKSISLDAFKAAYLSMDPKNLEHNFEVFGLDFMIDADFNVWLIQVNTNPCLQINAGILRRIIPTMLEHSFRLTLDPLFPPTKHYPNTVKHCVPDNALERLQFQMIFDESRDGQQMEELFRDVDKNKDLENIQEDQDTFDNEGKEADFDIQ